MINDKIVAPIRRLRPVLLTDVRAFVESDPDCLVPEAPARTPQKCERYDVLELAPKHLSEADPHQVIISENTYLYSLTSKARALRHHRQELHEEFLRTCRAFYANLRRTCTMQRVRWVKTVKTVWVPGRFIKVPTGRYKTIFRRVSLKPRAVIKKIKSFAPGRDGRAKVVWIKRVIPDYRPRVLRPLVVPEFVQRWKEPRTRHRTVRVRKIVTVPDYNVIRERYYVFKKAKRARLEKQLLKLESELTSLINQIKERTQAPHRLIAYSECGWIPPSWKEYYYHHHRGRDEYEEVSCPRLPSLASIAWRVTRQGWGHLSSESWSVAGLGIPWYYTSEPVVGDAQHVMGLLRQYGTPHKVVSESEHVHSTVVPGMLYPRTVVDRLESLDSRPSSLGDSLDVQAESLAASNVAALRKAGDFTFNLPRSIGELKDSRQTFRQARDFLRWFALGVKARKEFGVASSDAFSTILRRTGSASLAIVSAYLAWKFAIQPTIQDCVTLRDNTIQWLVATRRTLMDTVARLRAIKSNIAHVRSKFFGADAVRRHHLKGLTMPVGADEVIVEASYWHHLDAVPIVRYSAHEGPTWVVSHWVQSQWDLPIGVDAAPFEEWGARRQGDKVEIFGSLPGSQIVSTYSTGGSTLAARGADFHQSSVCWPDQRSSFSMPLSGYSEDSVDKLLADGLDWPNARVTGYVKNQVEGVVFARYQLGELISFLDSDIQESELSRLASLLGQMAGWDVAFNRLYSESAAHPPSSLTGKLSKAVTELDALYVAWQLTPLSFVYDWFTTSESIALRLNNLATSYFAPAPPAMDGVWVTKRVELLAGRPGLEVLDSLSDWYISDWFGTKLELNQRNPITGQGMPNVEVYAAWPKRIVHTLRFRYRTDQEVQLDRSGLYAAKRGEFIANGWESFLPQVQVKINASKVGTLLGILAGFIAPK